MDGWMDRSKETNEHQRTIVTNKPHFTLTR
jgi:hypothetical protein